MNIKGCTIRTDSGLYAIWLNHLEDNKVHARIRRPTYILDREDWWVDHTFDNEDEAMQSCCHAILTQGFTIEEFGDWSEINL